MSLLDVMAFIQKRHAAGAGVTPVTPDFSGGVTPEPAWIGVVPPVTPVTPHLYKVQAAAPIAPPGAAPEHPAAVEWRGMDKAYQAHHFKCAICIAAGRGVRYGLRGGTGAALWTAYSEAGQQPGALPWHQPKKGLRRD